MAGIAVILLVIALLAVRSRLIKLAFHCGGPERKDRSRALRTGTADPLNERFPDGEARNSTERR